MRDSVRTFRPEAEGFVYWVCNCGFEVRLSHTASRRDRQTAQHKQYVHYKNCRGGGVEQLKMRSLQQTFCNCSSPRGPMKLDAGFVGGAIGCFVLRPIVRGTNGSA